MNAKANLETLLAASVMALGVSHGALAQDTIKIGSVLSVTGPSSFERVGGTSLGGGTFYGRE